MYIREKDYLLKEIYFNGNTVYLYMKQAYTGYLSNSEIICIDIRDTIGNQILEINTDIDYIDNICSQMEALLEFNHEVYIEFNAQKFKRYTLLAQYLDNEILFTINELSMSGHVLRIIALTCDSSYFELEVLNDYIYRRGEYVDGLFI